MDWDKLREPFPKEAVHWRAQNLSERNGNHFGLALAYIDARDLMDRLDDACGIENWKDEYSETPRGRVICTISIRVGDEWISKSDGAGDTQVEGEKGAISDAFKRAGVKWGVARELYSLGNVWCPCEVKSFNGKKMWKAWTDDPWKFVKEPIKSAPPARKPRPVTDADIAREVGKIETITDLEELRSYWQVLVDKQPDVARAPEVIGAKDERKAALLKEQEDKAWQAA